MIKYNDFFSVGKLSTYSVHVTVANPILNEVCNPDFTFLAFAMSVSEIQSLPSSLATVIYAALKSYD